MSGRFCPDETRVEGIPLVATARSVYLVCPTLVCSAATNVFRGKVSPTLLLCIEKNESGWFLKENECAFVVMFKLSHLFVDGVNIFLHDNRKLWRREILGGSGWKLSTMVVTNSLICRQRVVRTASSRLGHPLSFLRSPNLLHTSW